MRGKLGEQSIVVEWDAFRAKTPYRVTPQHGSLNDLTSPAFGLIGSNYQTVKLYDVSRSGYPTLLRYANRMWSGDLSYYVSQKVSYIFDERVKAPVIINRMRVSSNSTNYDISNEILFHGTSGQNVHELLTTPPMRKGQGEYSGPGVCFALRNDQAFAEQYAKSWPDQPTLLKAHFNPNRSLKVGIIKIKHANWSHADTYNGYFHEWWADVRRPAYCSVPVYKAIQKEFDVLYVVWHEQGTAFKRVVGNDFEKFIVVTPKAGMGAIHWDGYKQLKKNDQWTAWRPIIGNRLMPCRVPGYSNAWLDRFSFRQSHFDHHSLYKLLGKGARNMLKVLHFKSNYEEEKLYHLSQGMPVSFKRDLVGASLQTGFETVFYGGLSAAIGPLVVPFSLNLSLSEQPPLSRVFFPSQASLPTTVQERLTYLRESGVHPIELMRLTRSFNPNYDVANPQEAAEEIQRLRERGASSSEIMAVCQEHALAFDLEGSRQFHRAVNLPKHFKRLKYNLQQPHNIRPNHKPGEGGLVGQLGRLIAYESCEDADDVPDKVEKNDDTLAESEHEATGKIPVVGGNSHHVPTISPRKNYSSSSTARARPKHRPITVSAGVDIKVIPEIPVPVINHNIDFKLPDFGDVDATVYIDPQLVLDFFKHICHIDSKFSSENIFGYTIQMYLDRSVRGSLKWLFPKMQEQVVGRIVKIRPDGRKELIVKGESAKFKVYYGKDGWHGANTWARQSKFNELASKMLQDVIESDFEQARQVVQQHLENSNYELALDEIETYIERYDAAKGIVKSFKDIRRLIKQEQKNNQKYKRYRRQRDQALSDGDFKEADKVNTKISSKFGPINPGIKSEVELYKTYISIRIYMKMGHFGAAADEAFALAAMLETDEMKSQALLYQYQEMQRLITPIMGYFVEKLLGLVASQCQTEEQRMALHESVKVLQTLVPELANNIPVGLGYLLKGFYENMTGDVEGAQTSFKTLFDGFNTGFSRVWQIARHPLTLTDGSNYAENTALLAQLASLGLQLPIERHLTDNESLRKAFEKNRIQCQSSLNKITSIALPLSALWKLYSKGLEYSPVSGNYILHASAADWSVSLLGAVDDLSCTYLKHKRKSQGRLPETISDLRLERLNKQSRAENRFSLKVLGAASCAIVAAPVTAGGSILLPLGGFVASILYAAHQHDRQFLPESFLPENFFEEALENCVLNYVYLSKHQDKIVDFEGRRNTTLHNMSNLLWNNTQYQYSYSDQDPHVFNQARSILFNESWEENPEVSFDRTSLEQISTGSWVCDPMGVKLPVSLALEPVLWHLDTAVKEDSKWTQPIRDFGPKLTGLISALRQAPAIWRLRNRDYIEWRIARIVTYAMSRALYEKNYILARKFAMPGLEKIDTSIDFMKVIIDYRLGDQSIKSLVIAFEKILYLPKNNSVFEFWHRMDTLLEVLAEKIAPLDRHPLDQKIKFVSLRIACFERINALCEKYLDANVSELDNKKNKSLKRDLMRIQADISELKNKQNILLKYSLRGVQTDILEETEKFNKEALTALLGDSTDFVLGFLSDHQVLSAQNKQIKSTRYNLIHLQTIQLGCKGKLKKLRISADGQEVLACYHVSGFLMSKDEYIYANRQGRVYNYGSYDFYNAGYSRTSDPHELDFSFYRNRGRSIISNSGCFNLVSMPCNGYSEYAPDAKTDVSNFRSFASIVSGTTEPTYKNINVGGCFSGSGEYAILWSQKELVIFNEHNKRVAHTYRRGDDFKTVSAKISSDGRMLLIVEVNDDESLRILTASFSRNSNRFELNRIIPLPSELVALDFKDFSSRIRFLPDNSNAILVDFGNKVMALNIAPRTTVSLSNVYQRLIDDEEVHPLLSGSLLLFSKNRVSCYDPTYKTMQRMPPLDKKHDLSAVSVGLFGRYVAAGTDSGEVEIFECVA